MTQTSKFKLRRCACASLRGTTRVLTQFYDEKMQASGLRVTQYSILSNIATDSPITVMQLAENLLMDHTTLTRNLRLLKEEGFVDSVPGADQRTRLITLTSGGQAALERAKPLWEQAQAQIVGGLGKERYHALINEMTALVAIIQDPSDAKN